MINRLIMQTFVISVTGTTNHLDQIVSQLKVPVYGLMRTADLPETNLVETAACYVKVTKLAIFLHPSTYGSKYIYDRYTGHKTCFLYSNVFSFIFDK